MRTDDWEDYPQREEPHTRKLARRAGAIAFGTLALSMVGMAAVAYGALALGRRAADGLRLPAATPAPLDSDVDLIATSDSQPAANAGIAAASPLPARTSLTGIP